MIQNFTFREVRLENKKFTQWIKQIYATTDGSLDCDQTQDGLPHYVDAFVDQQAIDATIKQRISDHLDSCPDCNEVFEGLKFVAEQVEESSVAASQTAVAAD